MSNNSITQRLISKIIEVFFIVILALGLISYLVKFIFKLWNIPIEEIIISFFETLVGFLFLIILLIIIGLTSGWYEKWKWKRFYQASDKRKIKPDASRLNNQDGTFTETYCYNSGLIYSEATYNANGLLDGMYKQYDSNGSLYAVVEYKDGKAEGRTKLYYPNGQVMREVNSVNDKNEGIAKEFYECGKLKSEINYRDDLQNGITKRYYKNGKLMAEEFYINGKKEGISKEFFKNGKLKAENVYIEGKRLSN